MEDLGDNSELEIDKSTKHRILGDIFALEELINTIKWNVRELENKIDNIKESLK